jgi:uncharacterized membrane protein
MAKLLGNLYITLGIGLLLAIVLSATFHADTITAAVITRWLHAFFGIVWIGLLYYFNFVQIPTMPTIPAELKPGVSKYIAPQALFYFRWGAAFTVFAGLLLAFNVWFIIWPNQKRALGLVEADDASKAKSAKTAMLTSRVNTLLSIPMLYAMTTYQTLPA